MANAILATSDIEPLLPTAAPIISLSRTSLSRPPIRVITMGDSKSVLVGSLGPSSALWWAMIRYHIDVRGVVGLGIGTTSSGNNASPAGLTSPDRISAMQAAIAASWAAGVAPVVIIKSGTNDTGLLAPAVIIANLRKAVREALAAGAYRVVLMPVDPKVGNGPGYAKLSASSARQIINVNRGMRQMAIADPRIAFADYISALVDQADGSFAPIGYGLTTGWGSMYDGALHESSYGAYLMSDALGRILSAIAARREAVHAGPADQFDATDNPRGNILGVQGQWGGTGGTTSNIRLSGGGGVTGVANGPAPVLFGAYPYIVGDLKGTMAVAITSEIYPGQTIRGDSANGAIPVKATCLTFSGTPSEDVGIEIGTGTNGAPGTGLPSLGEADCFFTDLVGSTGMGFVVSDTSGEAGVGGLANIGNTSFNLPKLNGRYLLFNPTGTPGASSGGNGGTKINLGFRGGAPVSGKFYIASTALYQEPALPAAAA